MASRVLAIAPEALPGLDARLQLGAVSLEGDLDAAIEAAVKAPVRSSGGTAVIPISGPISPKTDMFTLFFGGTGLDRLRANLRAALADDAVKSIVLDIDSPGGDVSGIDEMAAEIHAARDRKPITALANHWMASAAYYLGSQASEVAVAPTGMAGSIGVIQIHADYSRAFEESGVSLTLITAGKYKGEGNGYAPLSEEARAHMQESVDDYYAMFVDAVARGRGVAPSAVRSGFGEGRMLTAKRAVSAGLADRIATLDQVLARHSGSSSGARAEAEPIPITTEHGSDHQELSTEALYALARTR